MRTILLLVSTALLATSASARPLHRTHRHILRAVFVAAPSARSGAAYETDAGQYGRHGSFNAGAAQVPPQGFYDGYQGPGSTVLRSGLAAQHDPGVSEELSPGAKQTATGGPAGGLPGFGGGM